MSLWAQSLVLLLHSHQKCGKCFARVDPTQMVAIYKNVHQEARMTRIVQIVHNKYKAQVVVISSVVDGGKDNGFPGVKPQI